MKTKAHLQTGNGGYAGDLVLGDFMLPPQVLIVDGRAYVLMKSEEYAARVGQRERSTIYREAYVYAVDTPAAEGQAAA